MQKEIECNKERLICLYLLYDGKQSKVYKTLNTTTNEIYATKMIERKNLNVQRKIDYIYSEYCMYHLLSFDNIIHLKKEMFTTKNNYYFILEYCNGQSLAHFKKEYENRNKQKLNEFYIKKLLNQIIKGLFFLHSKYFIHRDIKLQNIFINFDEFPPTVEKEDYSKFNLDQKFSIRIGDFGFAKFLSEGEKTFSKVGTHFTAAPEVINSNGKGYNEKADLWSLGAITYDLIIGYDHNDEEIINKLEKGIFYIPNHKKISVEIIHFISGLLHPNPNKRFDWEKIKSHPFITNDEKNFKYINIETINNEDLEIDCTQEMSLIKDKLKINKDYSIWDLYINNNKLTDKIQILEQTLIQKENLIKNYELAFSKFKTEFINITKKEDLKNESFEIIESIDDSEDDDF